MSMPGRRVRVAVVFGGRSTEHAISCVSAGSVLAALDPARYEVVPVGITPKGAWVLTSGDPETLRIAGRELPTVETGTAVVLPGDPTAGGLVVVEPGEGARRAARGGRGLPGAARAVRRGRDDPGAAGDGRRAVRGLRRAGQRGGDGQGVHQEAAGRRGPAGRAVRGGPGRGVAGRRRTGSGSGCRCSSSRPAAGRRSGSAGWTTGPRCRRRSRRPGRPTTRCWSRRRCRGGRSSSRCWRGSTARPPDVSVPAEILLTRRAGVVRLRGQVPRRRLRPGHPGRPAGGRDRAAAGAGGAGVHRAGLRRPGPGRLLRRPRRTRSRSTR